MTFFDRLKSFIITTEAEIETIVVKIRTEEQVLASEINNALHWIAANTPQIAADIQGVVGIAETVGVAANPQVAAAITAANLAVTALNAFAAASNAGKSNPEAVVQGYVAVKQAQAAIASAKATAVKLP